MFLNAVLQKIQSTAHGTIGLAGGSTPIPLYTRMATEISGASYYITDERYVPITDAHSNAGTIRPLLGDDVHGFDTSLPIEDSLSVYAKEIAAIDPFDMIILGMGEDGHTVSLFPGSSTLDVTAITAHTPLEYSGDCDRLTISKEIVMNAKLLLLLLAGDSKHGALEELMKHEKTMQEFPTMMIHEHPNAHVFFSEEKYDTTT